MGRFGNVDSVILRVTVRLPVDPGRVLYSDRLLFDPAASPARRVQNRTTPDLLSPSLAPINNTSSPRRTRGTALSSYVTSPPRPSYAMRYDDTRHARHLEHRSCALLYSGTTTLFALGACNLPCTSYLWASPHGRLPRGAMATAALVFGMAAAEPSFNSWRKVHYAAAPTLKQSSPQGPRTTRARRPTALIV